ncbi:MAG: 4Fe-4S dicluster domain-containing protein [Candidatus Thermoplasmatota archaeon]
MLKFNREKCSGCRACMVICSLVHYKVNNPKKARIRIETNLPDYYSAKFCNQCKKCISSCEENAIFEKNGIIRIDEKKCNNCLACVKSCPENAIFVHREVKKPMICDCCKFCVEFCPTNALVLSEG